MHVYCIDMVFMQAQKSMNDCDCVSADRQNYTIKSQSRYKIIAILGQRLSVVILL